MLLTVGSQAEDIDRIELWRRSDAETDWKRAEFERAGERSVLFKPGADGRYGLYFVLENEAGRSAEPPTADSSPHLMVVVDTTTPTIQIHSARASRAGGDVDLRLTVIEENLGPSGLMLFYRSNESEPWRTGGALAFTRSSEDVAAVRVRWPLPAGLGGKIDLLVAATDLAGNSARDQITNVGIPAAARESASDLALAADATVETIGDAAATTQPSFTLPSRETAQATQRLRTLAARALLEGKHGLAAARFEEALAANPEDPALLSEYGQVLVRSGRYDDARARFEAALRLSPTDAGAREGLALVATGQGRYADARDELRKLLDGDPKAGRLWLRLGDLEYRLGRKTNAFDAWDRVLTAESNDLQLTITARERLRMLKR